MKSLAYRVALILGFMLFGCSPQTSTLSRVTATATPPSVTTPAPETKVSPPTKSALDFEKENILAQIKQLANDYNAQVEQYRQSEQAKIVADPNTGQEKLELSRAAINHLSPFYDNVYEQIGDLNEKYWELYQKDHSTDPLPTSMSKDELTQYRQKLVDDFNAWEVNELKNGTVIKLYKPEDMAFYRTLVGDSYGVDRLKWNYITRIIALSNAPSEELMNLDIQKFHQIDGGAVSLIAVSAYPFYRTDINLQDMKQKKHPICSIPIFTSS